MRLIFALLSSLAIQSADAKGSFFKQLRCYWNALRLLPFLSSFPKLPEQEVYPLIFRDDSIVSFAQAGDYIGPEDIAEYIGIADSRYTKYIDDGVYLRQPFFAFLETPNEEDQCELQFIFTVRATYSAEYTSAAATKDVLFMFKFFQNLTDGYLDRANAYFSPGFVNSYWGDLLNSDPTREYICSVMHEACAGILPYNESCVSVLENLPAVEGDIGYADGKTQGCRSLHASFAETNPGAHCPHISFEPLEDPDGSVKCQVSQGRLPSELFDDEDFDTFNRYARHVGIDPEIGYRVVR